MPRGRRELPAECLRLCAQSDLIIHAGDLMEASTYEDFEAIGPPLAAVHGNVDSAELRRRLPEELSLELDRVKLAVIHDAGPRRGRIERLKARFPGHDAVIFGHSHLPLHETDDGFQIFNPGSPTERRRSPFKAMGQANLGPAGIEFDLIDLGT